jgi:hypothetical protein
MNFVVTIYTALLFFVLSPGILISLPPKSSKMVVTATHALIFALIYHFTHKMVWRASMSMNLPQREGAEPMNPSKKPNVQAK